MRLFVSLFASLLLIVAPVAAQVTIPFTFTSGTVASSSQVNSNFSQLGNQALNRSGGTITGTIVVDAGITIDGVDISASIGNGVFTGNRASLVGTTSPQLLLGYDGSNDLEISVASDGAVTLTAAGSGAAFSFSHPITVGTLNLTTLTCTGCVNATQLASTAVTPTAYGSTTAIPTFTVDADGRLTAAGTTATSALTGIAEGGITDGSILARVASAESITGAWGFLSSGTKPTTQSDTTQQASFGAWDGPTEVSVVIAGATRSNLILGSNFSSSPISGGGQLRFMYGPRSQTSIGTGEVARIYFDSTTNDSTSGANLIFQTRPTSGSLSTVLTLSSTGEAIFSGRVTTASTVGTVQTISGQGGSVDNVSVSATTDIIYVSGLVSNTSWTGMTGGTSGRRVSICNDFENSFTLAIAANSSSSLAANRFVSGVAAGSFDAGACLDFIYVDSLWHRVAF